MKLLNQLVTAILEQGAENRPTVLYSNIINNKLVQLLSTKHQRKERFGNLSYKEIVKRYKDFIEISNSKYAKPPRLAVPDTMVRDLFVNNLEKIIHSFESENPKNNQLIFVKRREENKNEEKFDNIEVLLAKEGNFFFIVTSAFSEDGQFLKSDVEEKKSKKVRIEGIKNNNILVIYL
jgi:hypothetical protein